MIITILSHEALHHIYLSSQIDGVYNIAIPLKKQIQQIGKIVGFENTWYFYPDVNLTGCPNNILLKQDSMYQFIYNKILIYMIVEQENLDSKTYVKYIPAKVMRIGRDQRCEISYDNKFLSNQHATLYWDGVSFYLKDMNSKNRTYRNKERCDETSLKIGDVLYFTGLKIIIGDQYIAINFPNHTSIALNKYQAAILNNHDSIIEETVTKSYAYFENLMIKQFLIKEPKNRCTPVNSPWIYTLGPSLTMGFASLGSTFFMIQNILERGGTFKEALPSIFMSGSMLLGTLLWPVLLKKHESSSNKRQDKINDEKYAIYLRKKEDELQKDISRQLRILDQRYPSCDKIKSMIRKGEIIYSDSKELHIRWGTYDREPLFEVNYAQFDQDIVTPYSNKLHDKFINTTRLLKHAPIYSDLKKTKCLGIACCKDREINLIGHCILQIAFFHDAQKVKIIVISKDDEVLKFRFLPHLFQSETMRFYVRDFVDARRVSNELINMISRKDMNDTHYVIISNSEDLENAMGCFEMFMNEEQHNISYIGVNVESHLYQSEISFFKDSHIRNNKLDTEFQKDIFSERLQREMLSFMMKQKHNLYKKKTYVKQLSMLQLYHISAIGELNILHRWNQHASLYTLNVPIGVDLSGNIITLDIHEKQHGPHGIIAGMTGSGKSEFIISYLLSLALNYHPEDVSFLLIDYKGGGMAEALSVLPHVCGVITNLDESSLYRSLLSMQYELTRRQKLFRDAAQKWNLSNLDIYRYQRLFHEGKVVQAISHLIIICDEFAELKKQHVEFMDFLISSARIGRSLGIHIILATQKPSGVIDDQIWSNARFHICLKVQERVDSMDMLKRSDATELLNAGQFIMQIGYNELFIQGQSAYCGSSYVPYKEHYPCDEIEIIDNTAKVIRDISLLATQDDDSNKMSEHECIINYISEAINKTDYHSEPLWLPSLSQTIAYADLITTFPMKDDEILLGMYDCPNQQCYRGFYLNIKMNTVLYGNSTSSFFLNAILYAFLKQYQDSEYQIYCFDFESELMSINTNSSALIHCNSVEDIKQHFKRVIEIVHIRKKCKTKWPPIMLIITDFLVSLEFLEENELLWLYREGYKVDVTIFMVCAKVGDLSYRYTPYIQQNIMLQQYDADAYRSVFQEHLPVMQKVIKGRGYFKLGNCYEFQTITDHVDE